MKVEIKNKSQIEKNREEWNINYNQTNKYKSYVHTAQLDTWMGYSVESELSVYERKT